MTERSIADRQEQDRRESAKQLLERFKPRSSENHDEAIRQEDIDKILEAIKADPNLTDEERTLLLEEAVNRYDRTANLPVYAHMGM